MSDEGDCRTVPATSGLLIDDKGVSRPAPAKLGLLISARSFYGCLT